MTEQDQEALHQKARLAAPLATAYPLRHELSDPLRLLLRRFAAREEHPLSTTGAPTPEAGKQGPA